MTNDNLIGQFLRAKGLQLSKLETEVLFSVLSFEEVDHLENEDEVNPIDEDFIDYGEDYLEEPIFKYIYLERNLLGEISGFRLSPSNVLTFDARELKKNLIKIATKGGGVLLATSFLNIILGVISIAIELDDLLYYRFSEQHAKVLHSIFFVEERYISFNNVIESYLLYHKEAISTSELNDSIKFLVDLKVVRIDDFDRIYLLDKVVFNKKD